MASTLKVLVVDDEADVGDLLVYGLGAAGFDVTVASSGSSALRATESWAPDVIVLDITLPDVDGFALLPRLRGITGSPILFLTARSRISDRERGLALGATDYVTKPFDMDDLIARLRAANR